MACAGRGVKFAIVTIATAISVAEAGAREQISDDPAQTEGYLVAPFENATKISQLDWMASALAVTLAEKMEAHPRLRPVYGPQILDGMPKVFDAEKVAQRAHDLGAKWIFTGSFARPNWKSEVRVQLYIVIEPSPDIPKRTLLKVLDIGDVAERSAVVDQLERHTLEILKQMKWTLDAESLALFKRRPTRDLYALTLWGRAMNLYYGYSGARDLKQAEKILKKACLIDPKFAEAHRALGLVYLEMGERAKASSQYSYALDLKPGYHAAMIGLARFYRAESQRARAQELVEKALDLRPWDVEAREMLGELMWENGELDQAMTELTRDPRPSRSESPPRRCPRPPGTR